MKMLFYLPPVVLCVMAGQAQTTNMAYSLKFQPSPSVFLGSTNVRMAPEGYNFYYSTNVAAPMSTWAFLTSTPATIVDPSSTNYIPVTNLVGTNTFPVSAFMFVTATYSNAAGTSFFCDPAGCQLTLFSPALEQFLAH